MKRIATILFLILISQNLFAEGNDEFRAIWVVVKEHTKSDLTAKQNKANVQEIMKNHKRANMNAVLWQCRQSGTAYYNSSYEPWGLYANYKDPGYDPLAYAVEEAHKCGLELHAWINVFYASDTHVGTPAAEHPEWICRDRYGNPMTYHRWISPGLDTVRKYTIDVAMEIVRNYDIDGLHLDYIRWNDEYSNPAFQSQYIAKQEEEIGAMDGFITEEQIEELLANQNNRYLYDIEHPYSAGIPQGFSDWEQWWRWSVTEFVRVLRDSIQAVKPWVRLSPAALGKYNWTDYQGYGYVYQDAALWFNEGYIDQLAPMHYHWSDGQEFYNMLIAGSPNCWGDYIQPGIQAGRLFSVGPWSNQLGKDHLWYRHSDIISRSRDVLWVDGFQFFSYGSWQDYQYWEEAGATFFKNKTKIRPTKLIVSNPPDAPTVALTKIDSLNYQIQVVPPISITTDHRYAIYRSPDANFDLDSDEIIDIYFGQSNYFFVDQFSGTQDYNGTYFYAATTLDRYWNESVISNTVQGDSVPSFPPTVIATIPAEGDSISVNKPIIFYFSKTMNPNTFTGAITISPAIEIDQLTWDNENKSLTINVKGNFAYATNYTVTIGASVSDINGKFIDGNGDGVGGDAFYLHFRTVAVDNIGPVVIYSYPDYKVAIDSFDVEEVVTILFDEIIDPANVFDSSLVLTQNENIIKTHSLVSTIADKSLISMKSYDSLLPETDYSLLLRNTITDTCGNIMDSDIQFLFHTLSEWYVNQIMIDDFSFLGYWWQPSQTYHFFGLVASGTFFGYDKDLYLPASATRPVEKRSAYITYQWIDTPPPEGYLLREYLNTGPPREVEFDTTYTLQCYIYGDRSRNKFRFCIDEGNGSSWISHEVSQWITIDWYGWKLLEWKLSDPSTVGTWDVQGNNGILDGSAFRFDSFQITHDNTGAISGRIYVDNLRVVKKSTEPVSVDNVEPVVSKTFTLRQNYPNPFNPTTTITFDLPHHGKVLLKVYNIMGRKVVTLVNETLEAGQHEIQFDGTQLASGIYFYRLEFEGKIKHKQMLLVK